MNEKCNNHYFVFVKYNTEGGRFQLRKQCLNCGEVDGHIYKYSECNNLNEIPLLNSELREERYKKISEIKAAEWELKKTQQQIDFEAERERRRTEYANYLQSYEWKRKHDYIMNKYGFRCILCFKPAVNVHHLTYKRIYLEDERDLVALCKSCHEFVHDLIDDSTIL